MKTAIFGNISEINVSASKTWRDIHFITLDIDWAHDDVISYAIDILEKHNVKATWFVTHSTPVLDRLRANPNFELGAHPNFNPLLNGGSSENAGGARKVLDALLEIVPEAKSVRSHSLTQSSILLDIFKEYGFTHDCNHFIPHESGVILRPWSHWNGLVRVPHLWEDDVEAMVADSNFSSLLAIKNEIKVFDFHPIHLFLNTEATTRYVDAKSHARDPLVLKGFRNDVSAGSETALYSLLSK